MQTVQTKTFQINIPSLFENIRTVWESVRAEHEDGDDAAMIAVGLNENSYYNKFKGNDFAERFYNCCLERRGEVEIVEDKTIEVAGHTSYIRMAKSTMGYFFFFAVLNISEAYSYDFIGDCETGKQAFYIPLFEEAWRTFQYFGNPQEAMEEQQKGLTALFANLSDTVESEKEATQIPEIVDFQIPEDGKESFLVDNIPFEYLPSSTFLVTTTGNSGNDLSINLKATVGNYDDKTHGHILNDYDDGEIYLNFTLKNIYKAGIPTGQVSFKKDRDVINKAYLWKGGFHYSLEFYGELTLKEGWVGFSGYFQNIMETKIYPISFAKKIPLEGLAWQHYRFGSLEEIRTAPKEVVHHLHLTDLARETFPSELFDYINLESFGLFYTDNTSQHIKLTEIPSKINTFTQLKELSFSGIEQVDVIPKEIGDLKKLRSLNIFGSKARTIPPEILMLPELEFCSLSNNHLTELPSTLSSSLKSLYLQNNQLTTLPASILNLPHLKWLNITKNPFESLPPDLQKVEKLDLELEKKQVLLDYEYKGADGKGIIAFKNEIFFAKQDRELINTLDKVIKETDFITYKKGLEMLALWAVALQTTEQDDYNKKGNTRFGGLPDLPPTMEYPTFTTYHKDIMGYQFIAQLNCEELAPYQSYLPREGVLYFFITDQEEFEAKVIYFDGELSALQSAKDLAVDEEFIYDDHGIFTPFRVKVSKYVSIPSFYGDDHLYKGDATNLKELEETNYDEVEAFRTSLLAHAVEPVHGLNSYVFKQHGSPQIEASNKLKGHPEDYIVLLRVSSDNNTGFSFWDAGEIYFVIHKSDLAKGDFSNIFCGLESS
ncbi:DUF1963 domain-containing protein [Olivibacter domesticus]|uniref:Leucine rich repeat-containing protein n=1 Tax=Olivibacter domesticus TaxID=407022 RepID=A0A1H7UBF5_OLID1|nr:DUF1963 domain-containing protein [Olivibacter domesticus]SEL94096.1 protein of unknown function [Olivibacter domesticus]